MLPSTFCWTKMGVESGESLDLIIRRKDWERQLGNGLFFWGIGQSLGENARDAAASVDGVMKVVFSPMASKAKDIDVTPGDVFVWNSWIDSSGESHTLPEHVLITSRADLPSGRRKTCHYALVCKSTAPLAGTTELEVTAAFLRNFSSDKSLGASQVTAVVRNAEYALSGNVAKKYSVSFVADMEAPYSIQLASPELLSRSEVQDIGEISASGNLADWECLVARLRSKRKPERHTPFTLDLFGMDQGLPATA